MPDSSTSISIGGITCWDEDAREQVTTHPAVSATATRTLLVAWSDHWQLIIALLGGYNGLSWVSPATYPGVPTLYARDVETEGVPGDDGMKIDGNQLVAFKYARLKVTYGTLSYDPAVQGSDSLEFAVEAMTVARTEPTYKWSGTTVPLLPEASPPLLIGTCTYVRERVGQATLPSATIQSLIGTVNLASFFGGAAGHVLYMGATTRREVSLAGNSQWTITHKFQYRTVAWNTYLRPDTGLWANIESIATGSPPYASGDFSLLIP